MALLQSVFDATQIDPTQGSGGLPIGKYPVRITASEIKPTKEGGGAYLELTLEVLDGPNTGSSGAFRLNIYNASEQAAQIAQKQLSAVCHACNVYQVQDTAQLHGIPFVVQVDMQKGSDKYTEVRKIFMVDGSEIGSAPAQAPAVQQPIQQPASVAGKPWGGSLVQHVPAQTPTQPWTAAPTVAPAQTFTGSNTVGKAPWAK